MVRNKSLLITFFIFSAIVLLIAQNTYALGNIKLASNYGLTTTAREAFGTLPESDISKIIGNIIFYSLGLVGVIFLTLIIIAGIQWMTAKGNDEAVKKAQGMLSQAILGLIVVMGAGLITWFILQKVITSVKTGQPTTPPGFNIYNMSSKV